MIFETSITGLQPSATVSLPAARAANPFSAFLSDFLNKIMENRCWRMAFFHNGQSYWIVPFCAPSGRHSNLKCQPWNDQNIFSNLGFINFPQEKAMKSALALPEVPAEGNYVLEMVRLLSFSSSHLQDLWYRFFSRLLIMTVHTVWPLSPQGLPSLLPGPWGPRKNSDGLAPIFISFPCHSHQALWSMQSCSKFKIPNSTSLSVFPTETSDAQRNSGNNASGVLCLNPHGLFVSKIYQFYFKHFSHINPFTITAVSSVFSNQLLTYILPLVFSFSNVCLPHHHPGGYFKKIDVFIQPLLSTTLYQVLL